MNRPKLGRVDRLTQKRASANASLRGLQGNGHPLPKNAEPILSHEYQPSLHIELALLSMDQLESKG